MSKRNKVVRNKPMALVGRDHPVLHQIAAPILGSEIDDYINLSMRMLATVRVKGGIAIAAPQVGVPVQLIVQWDGKVLINPEVEVDGADPTDFALEACLSIPGRSFRVERATKCKVSAWDFTKERHEYDAEGLDARMIQHELDHLNGMLISDRGDEVRGSQAGLRM